MRVAIIPARGGSKRIPNKNIRLFAGKPLIAYSLDAAKRSGCFDSILVSTDSEEIADVARQYGGEIPFLRPADLSDDHTGTDAVVRHALRWLQNCGKLPDYTCCVYPTAPFLSPQDLRQGLEKLATSPDKLFAFSVTSFPFPIQRAIRLTADSGVEPFQPECIPMRSQDLEDAYHDAGQFYWGKTTAFLDGQAVFAPHSIPLILPRFRVQDIDTPEDWVRAEYLHRAIQLSEVETDARRVSC